MSPMMPSSPTRDMLNLDMQEEGFFQLPRSSNKCASVSNFSTFSHGSGRTRSSARSGGGHNRRGKRFAQPDPRGVYASIEAILIQAGGRFGDQIRKAAFCVREPLERRMFETVIRRIRGGADCNVKGHRGKSLSHIALDGRNPQVAQVIIEAGDSADNRDNHGKTLLWRAIEGKHIELAQACIECNANLSLGLGEENDGTAAHLAVELNLTDIALQILQRTSVRMLDKVDTHGRTVLWRALELKRKDVVRMCLARFADVTVIDQASNRGLLHLALDTKQEEFIRDLLQSNAPCQILDKRSRTPLKEACTRAHEQIVNLLLEAGARPGPVGGEEALAVAEAGLFALSERLVRVGGPPRLLKSTTRSSLQEGLPQSPRGLDAGKKIRRKTFSKDDADLCAIKRLITAGSEDNESQQKTLLMVATQARQESLMIAYLEVSLKGVGLDLSTAQEIAKGLTKWTLERESDGIGDEDPEEENEEVKKRVALLESLAHLISDEGCMAAAGDLHKAGAPREMVDTLASMKMMSRGRKSSRDLHRSAVSESSLSFSTTDRTPTCSAGVQPRVGLGITEKKDDVKFKEIHGDEDGESRKDVMFEQSAEGSLDIQLEQSTESVCVPSSVKEEESG